MFLIDWIVNTAVFLSDPYNWYLIFLIAIGVSAIIFFHELGHFLVARWCGVKCEKFYVGFGKPLVKFQLGETEYGLGMIPLGGYVKMLGQDDNPNKAAEEMERAKTGEGDGAEALDPRSYLAKSVPQRMAIISAGVIMNVIFAFFVASATFYWLGVDYQPSVVSALSPGNTAWKNGVKVGDRITHVGDVKIRKFRDLRGEIMLGNIANGVEMIVERPSPRGPEEIRLWVYPSTDSPLPVIGILGPMKTVLRASPARENTTAAQATPPLEKDDVIVAVDGKPIDTHAQMHAVLAEKPDTTLPFTISRAKESRDGESRARETLTIDIAPNPFKELGLVMAWGKITAIQKGSPAESAGLKKGDLIKLVDRNAPVDPLKFPDYIRGRGSDTIKITVQRDGEDQTVDLMLRPVATYETPFGAKDPLSVPAMGIAYLVLNRVERVVEGSPAAQANLKAGDIIEWIEFVQSDDAKDKERIVSDERIKFDDENPNWAVFAHTLLQYTLADTKVRIKPKDREPSVIAISNSTSWFNPDRGLNLTPVEYRRQAESFSHAISLGAVETWEQLTLIWRGLRAIGRGQVSPKQIHGPVGIAGIAFSFAQGGWSKYLIFLTMLSANLAVINFLPIPILDGGHMVFLTYEGIRGKPPSEKVMVGAMYVGLLFLVTIIVFASSLDVGIISRN